MFKPKMVEIFNFYKGILTVKFMTGRGFIHMLVIFSVRIPSVNLGGGDSHRQVHNAACNKCQKPTLCTFLVMIP